MARWFLTNLGLIVLAVLISLAAWTLASLQEDPIIEDALAVRVVRVNALSTGDYRVIDRIPTTIIIRARGARSALNAMSTNVPTLTVDVGALSEGEHVIPLTPTLTGPVRVLATLPQTGTISIERLTRLTLPVRLTLSGAPALGFRTGPATLSPLQATVSGSRAAAQRVSSIEAQISIDGAKSAVQADARLIARDANGDALGDVQVSPEVVSVKVPLEQLSNYRDLPVTPKWRGQPAAGYAVTAIAVDPQIVTVFGDTEVIQAAKGFIETQDVVISGASSDIDTRVNLIVPPGLSLVSERASVRVQVRIQALTGSRTVKRKPVVLGLSGTLTSTLSPESVDLVLSGPLPSLTDLLEDDVRLTVDVTGLEAGVYQLTPRVIVPDGITVQSVIPTTVRVEISPRKR